MLIWPQLLRLVLRVSAVGFTFLIVGFVIPQNRFERTETNCWTFVASCNDSDGAKGHKFLLDAGAACSRRMSIVTSHKKRYAVCPQWPGMTVKMCRRKKTWKLPKIVFRFLSVVGSTSFELVTPAVWMQCSTPELTALSLFSVALNYATVFGAFSRLFENSGRCL